jgi:nuclear pore complex protein Nup93
LYNLAEDYITVVACLAQALGTTVGQASPDEKARGLEKTAAEILRHYERANRAVGRERDAVVRLLRIREAVDAKNGGRPEVALDVRFVLLFSFLVMCFSATFFFLSTFFFPIFFL